MTTALQKLDQETLPLPASVDLLPDNSQYTNRFHLVSASSGNKYKIAQRKYNPKTGKGGWWACDCPSYIHGRRGAKMCKHLRDLGLPGNHQPFFIGELGVGQLDGGVGGKTLKDNERHDAARKPLRALQGGKSTEDSGLLIRDKRTYEIRTEIKALGGKPHYEGGKFQGWEMPSQSAYDEVMEMLDGSAKAAPAPKAQPKALPGVVPTNVNMQDGKIMVEFDAKDSAAVFALLAELSK